MRQAIAGFIIGFLVAGVIWKELSPEARRCHALGGDLYIEGCTKEVPAQYIHLPD